MAYSGFTMTQLEQQFGLQVEFEPRLFADVPPLPIGSRLREQLTEDAELALGVGTEKARSEFLIAPILAEVRRQMNRQVSLFSGAEFNVDMLRGLAGFCDYLFTLSTLRIEIQAPVISVVEAKKEEISKGIPQCFAELIAAQQFNAAAERPIATLYGAVTTGTEWQFLRLRGTLATIDQTEHHFSNVEQIVGIFVWMLHNAAA